MIPDAGHVSAALAGAFRLLRFDAGGFGFFDDTIEGFWRSFFAAVVILPGYILLVALRLEDAELANPLFRIAAVEGIGYVIGWVAFPLVMAHLTAAFGAAGRYPGYIVAYNWFAAPQVAVLLSVALLRESGLFPPAMETGLSLGAVAYLMAVQWFIARRALEIHPAAALAVVALDMTISLFLSAVTAAMLASPGA